MKWWTLSMRTPPSRSFPISKKGPPCQGKVGFVSVFLAAEVDQAAEDEKEAAECSRALSS